MTGCATIVATPSLLQSNSDENLGPSTKIGRHPRNGEKDDRRDEMQQSWLFQLGGVARWFVWLLSLLSKPMMFFDPLFGFCLGLKFAEAATDCFGRAAARRQHPHLE
jgi:hypothetical protein